MTIRREDFPLPDTEDPRTAAFFAGAARQELVLPMCDRCDRLCWYPERSCPRCGHASFTWTAVAGRGRLYSWAVVRRAFLPAFGDMVPFVTGLAALDVDPDVRIVSYVVDCEPETLHADQRLEAVFRPLAFPTVPGKSVVVPMFVPAAPVSVHQATGRA